MKLTHTEYTIISESLESYRSLWHRHEGMGAGRLPFVTPAWMESWWEVFGQGRRLQILSVYQGARLLGTAPLMIDGARICFVGDPAICDYQDLLLSPGAEASFASALLGYLRRLDMERVELAHVRPESKVMTILVPAARMQGWEVFCAPEAVSYEMALAPSWDLYLARLKAKQRHEIKRKWRRLEEAGKVRFEVVSEVSKINEYWPRFLELFQSSRRDKAAFLTPRMERFFSTMVRAMALEGLVQMGLLDLEGKKEAAVLCLRSRDTLFLYNNGYNPDRRALNVGLLSKAMSIRHAIEQGLRVYDFLKGEEVYKKRLGARPVELYRCLLKPA